VTINLEKRHLSVGGLMLTAVLSAAVAQPAQDGASKPDRERIQKDIEDLKAAREKLTNTMRDFDRRIKNLETATGQKPSPQAAASQNTAQALPVELGDVTMDPDAVSRKAANQPLPYPPNQPEPAQPESWGTYEPGRGFVLARGKLGEISVSLIAYARYLNQLGLDKSYTDSFGRTFTPHLRQDIQWNKVNLSFKGWMFNPDFTYRVWIWTQQPAMGEPAQVVVGGHLGYHFTDWLNVYAGIAPLPSTRSTNWSYPFWLKMDNRTSADEFFRASYSQGVWADGEIAKGLQYRVMLANNLSALGISASQLNADLSTVSGFVWWMPTTGEFGPGTGFGDFEGHEKAATLFGVHYTRSREDAQEQPGTDAIENSQIRLSDGTLLFSTNAFNTGGQITDATYQMLDIDTGIKYRGFSLEGEYYTRWVNDFRIIGNIPISHLYDTGFQLQGSAMLLPRQLQIYVSGSQIYGHYGNPWDISTGLNWYPFERREMHINMQGIYDHHSPVGGLSYPYIVGGNGWIFNTDVILTF
jgi:hypothetical protein